MYKPVPANMLDETCCTVAEKKKKVEESSFTYKKKKGQPVGHLRLAKYINLNNYLVTFLIRQSSSGIFHTFDIMLAALGIYLDAP